MRYYISPPPANPLSRIVAAILAVMVIVASAIFGLFLFAAAVGLGLLAWMGLALRAWWARRRGTEQPERRPRQAETIDAEYTVISKRRD